MRRTQLLEAFNRFQRQTDRFLDLLAQDGVSYRVTGTSPDDVDFTSEDWDGSEATASAPNPSEDDDAPSQLDAMFLLAPEGDDARGQKSNWKLPFRSSPDGPVNTNAVTAIISAINGGRGGVEGVSRSALESAFDKAVQFGVESGIYDDAGDAPDFSPANASIVDDVPDPELEGAGSQPDDPDPGDGDDAPVDTSLSAEVTGTLSVRRDGGSSPAGQIEVEAQAGDGLVGIVWGAGDHDLSLGGEPTPVHVPEDTIPDTFQALRDDVDSGDVTIGLDHADGDAPVLAETGLIDIAVARDVALAADERHIVLTESEFKNDQAAEAHADGAFEEFDFSVVADVAVRTDDDGDRVHTDGGRVVLDATRIKRIDAVEEGAVEAASIGAIPDLAEQASAAVDANNYDAVTDAIQATVAELSEQMQDPDFTTDPESLDAAQSELEAAADAVDTLQDQVADLEAESEAFERVAAAHDVDVDEHDDVEAAAQAVVDAQTESIREDIAEYEAALAAYDTDDDSIEERTDELAGKSAAELKARRGNLAHEHVQAQERAAEKGAGVTRGDKDGHTPGLAGGNSGDDDGEADDLALEAMGARDKLQQGDSNLSPAEFVRANYDVDPSDFDNPGELNAAMFDATAAPGGDD